MRLGTPSPSLRYYAPPPSPSYEKICFPDVETQTKGGNWSLIREQEQEQQNSPVHQK